MAVMNRHWPASSIPDQSGRVAVITGANSGLGFATARILASKNARVVLACRNKEKAESAAEQITRQTGNHQVDVVIVALDQLESVRTAAKTLLAKESRIDLLINNAGAMISEGACSAEGVEMNMAVNYLGHFALTGLLLPKMLSTPGSRTVAVGSLGHYLTLGFPKDLTWNPQQKFRLMQAYGHSKIAVLLFIQALQRRLSQTSAHSVATAAHPGGAQSELIRSRMAGMPPALARKFFQAQSAEEGAQPILRAALDPNAEGAEYFGPGGLLQISGPAVRVAARPMVFDVRRQEQLWKVSEALTQVRFPI